MNPAGTVLEHYHYNAFGEESDSPADIQNPWRYAGKRTDPETGLVYFGKRYYSPTLGRWITADPLSSADGPNLYIYTHNNPHRYYDPQGFFSLPSFSFKQNGNSFLNNGPPSVAYFDSYEKLQPWYPESCCLTLGKPDVQDVGIIFANGIDCTIQDTFQNMEYISKLSGGYNVEAVYNATHHWSMDTVESILNLNYIATPPVRHLHHRWDSFFDRSSKDAICFNNPP